jgi:hypothetical protein
MADQSHKPQQPKRPAAASKPAKPTASKPAAPADDAPAGPQTGQK